jgi:flavin-binding protein dodecin
MKKSITKTGTSTTKNATAAKKLTLAKQTLRHLNVAELARIVGGNEQDPSPSGATCTFVGCPTTL